jgi:hypothetical protein
MTGLTALCACDISDILTALLRMTFSMGQLAVIIAIIPSKREWRYMLNVPSVSNLDFSFT